MNVAAVIAFVVAVGAGLVVVWRIEVGRLLAEQDRRSIAQMTELMVLVERAVRAALDTVLRIETAAAGVAEDLAAAHVRADAAAGPDGAAADAAAKTGDA